MSFSMLVKPVPELMICPSASAAVLMAEACNIGLEPLIRIKCSCTDPTPAELDKSELSAG
ncbi:hypothetical protein AB2G98_25195 (plasmid) [Escherichia coli]